jgi:histidine ammonia-lyase
MAPHAVIAGGAGATLSLEQVLAVVHGAEVVMDSSASLRCKKESPAPKAFQAEDPPAASPSPTCSLDRAQTRAALFYKLLSLINGRSGVRLPVVEALAALLNAGVTPALPAADSDGEPLAALASFLQGVGSAAPAGPGGVQQSAAEALAAAGIEVPGLSAAERALVQDAQSASAGTAAICVQAGKLLLAAANAVAALSAEALQADVSVESSAFAAGRAAGHAAAWPQPPAPQPSLPAAVAHP